MVSEDQVWEALKGVRDPELPINVVDLGLVYDVRVRDGSVGVKMTLTVKGCPMHQTIAKDVRERILQMPGVKDAEVEIVWDPRWTRDMITPEGRQMLGL